MNRTAVNHLLRVDKTLAHVIRRVGSCRLSPVNHRSPFQALVQAVTHQQLNGTAAGTILRRVRALYPHRRFPKPEDLLATPDEQLRGAGLSRAKTASVKDIATKTIEGVVPTSRAIKKMSDAEIVDRLTTVRGVGPWTVEMLLMFTLGRLDVLPVTDYGVRCGFARVYGLNELPSPRTLLAHGERWRPFRSVASWYLWRALELPK